MTTQEYLVTAESSSETAKQPPPPGQQHMHQGRETRPASQQLLDRSNQLGVVCDDVDVMSPRALEVLGRNLSRAARAYGPVSVTPWERKREVTEAEQHRAATTIQGLGRGFFVRLRNKRHKAAITIQRHVKGLLTRRRTKRRKTPIEETSESMAEYQGNVAGFYNVSGICVPIDGGK